MSRSPGSVVLAGEGMGLPLTQPAQCILQAWPIERLGRDARIDDRLDYLEVVEVCVCFGLGPLGVEAHSPVGLLVGAHSAVDDRAGCRHVAIVC